MPDLPWEDNLLERKLESDLKDLLKTLVAFANSVKPGHVAVILIGERDDGITQGVTNPDAIQKTVRDTCDKIYPPIVWRSNVYERERVPCVRVEIEYDGETPHFGGGAWIRRGSVTIPASDEVFQRLIDFRLSTARELAKWIDKEITMINPSGSGSIVRLVDLTSFWVTIQYLQPVLENKSIPLGQIVLSWDDNRGHLKILVSGQLF